MSHPSSQMSSEVNGGPSSFGDSSCRPVSPSMLANPPPASRDPCRKVLKGQFLSGSHSVYDIDKQLPSDSSHNLEALPISVYGWDPALVAGRQIAVNKRYICYCLRPGSVRILSRNVAAWGLFQAHLQKVTDIAFFGESVHVVASASSDGRLFVWKISEDAGVDGRVKLIDQILLGIQFDGEWKDAHPSVCWHPSSQECLLLCISKYILKIDMKELSLMSNSFSFSAECFLSCSITNLITGVHLIGQHSDDVTDLCALCQETLYIASSSKDGMVRVWADGTTKPLAVFIPHEGQPVSSISFIDAPSKPSKAVLLTGGYLNQSLKLWAPTGSLESIWCSMQTLELKSSAEGSTDRAFCNQVRVVPQTGIVLLGNSKKHAMYSIHLGFGKTANETRMDYLVEFAMSMPILSLTATADIGANHKGIIQVFCIQTQAIQEYFLNVSICLPPQQEEGSDLATVTGELELFKPYTPDEGEGERESAHGKASAAKLEERGEPALGNRSMVCEHNSGSGFGSWVEVPTWVAATIKKNAKLGSMKATPESYLSSERLLGGSLLSNIGPPLSSRLPSSNLAVEKPKLASGSPVGAQRESIRSQLVTPSELMAMACFPAASNEAEENFAIMKMNTRTEGAAALRTSQPEASASVPKQEEGILSETGSLYDEGNAMNEHPGPVKRTHNAKKKKNKNKNRDGCGEVRGAQECISVPSSMAENGSKEFTSWENKPHQNIGASEITLRDLTVNVSDMQESLNQLLGFQKELHRHVSEAVLTELSTETQRTAAAFEQGLNGLLSGSLDSHIVKINDVKKDMDAFKQEAFQQLALVITDCLDKKAIPAFESLLKMEAPLLESTITELQSFYFESILTAVLPRNLESHYQNSMKLMENSLLERLSTLISHQLQSNLLLEKQSMQV